MQKSRELLFLRNYLANVTSSLAVLAVANA